MQQRYKAKLESFGYVSQVARVSELLARHGRHAAFVGMYVYYAYPAFVSLVGLVKGPSPGVVSRTGRAVIAYPVLFRWTERNVTFGGCGARLLVEQMDFAEPFCRAWGPNGVLRIRLVPSDYGRNAHCQLADHRTSGARDVGSLPTWVGFAMCLSPCSIVVPTSTGSTILHTYIPFSN